MINCFHFTNNCYLDCVAVRIKFVFELFSSYLSIFRVFKIDLLVKILKIVGVNQMRKLLCYVYIIMWLELSELDTNFLLNFEQYVEKK